MTKTFCLILGALALALGAGCTSSASKSKGGGTAKVTFVAPERYTDFRASGPGGDADRAAMLTKLEAFIQAEAARQLQAGRYLDVRVVDIDQGGDIRDRGSRNLRVVDDNTSAEIRVDYALTDGSGRVVKSGEDRLIASATNLPFPELNQEEMPLLKAAFRSWIGRLAKL